MIYLRVLFTTADDVASRSIQIFTGSRISHVALVLEGAAGDEVIHAVGEGVVHEPRERLYGKRRYRDVAEFVILPPVELSGVLARLGQPYDYPEIASRPVLKGLRAAAPWLPAAIASRRRRSCARLVLDLDPDRRRIPEWRDVSRHSATPADLAARVGSSFRRCG